MSIFGRKPLSDLVVPFKFGISILKKPYMQSFMLSAESEHLDHFLLHIRSTTSRRFDAATVISMIESGLFSADDSSSSSEDDYFDLSDPEATIYDHNFIL